MQRIARQFDRYLVPQNVFSMHVSLFEPQNQMSLNRRLELLQLTSDKSEMAHKRLAAADKKNFCRCNWCVCVCVCVCGMTHVLEGRWPKLTTIIYDIESGPKTGDTLHIPEYPENYKN